MCSKQCVWSVFFRRQINIWVKTLFFIGSALCRGKCSDGDECFNCFLFFMCMPDYAKKRWQFRMSTWLRFLFQDLFVLLKHFQETREEERAQQLCIRRCFCCHNSLNCYRSSSIDEGNRYVNETMPLLFNGINVHPMKFRIKKTHFKLL